MSSRAPRYRIQTVAEMTGIPASTLRAWERRYGVPSPERTTSAYRLYSDHDLDQVRRMRDLCAEGLAPSEAAQCMSLDAQPEEPVAAVVGDAFAEAIARIVAAALAYDTVALRAEVHRATYLGSALNVYERVLAPAMRELGQLWHEGRATVAQEHLASEAVRAALADILRLVQHDQGRLALLACFAGEQHHMPLYGVAFELAQWGMRVEILGEDVPPDALAAAVAAMHPELVGLSVSVSPPELRAGPLLDAYAAACAGHTWLVGGEGARGLRVAFEARGALVCAGDLGAMRAELERAMGPKKELA